jgi:hypothetical protein
MLFGVCALFVVVCLIAGCGGGGATEGEVTGPPVISQVRAITPSGLCCNGGYITIQAIASDDTAVASVVATVTGPNGTSNPTHVTLTATTLTVFYGVFSAPAISTGGSEQYTVVVNATDESGNKATPVTATFTVPDVPPPPPI